MCYSKFIRKKKLFFHSINLEWLGILQFDSLPHNTMQQKDVIWGLLHPLGVLTSVI